VQSTEAQIVVLKSEVNAEEAETLKLIEMEKAIAKRFAEEKTKMAKSRKADKFSLCLIELF
jgi:hypothetical protein